MKAPANLMLRLAVVMGAASFVVGAAGFLLLALRTDADAPAHGGRRSAEVHLQGAPSTGKETLVEVRWREGDEERIQRARPGEAPGVWIVPPVPEGRVVTLSVRRGPDGAVLHEVHYEQGLPPRVEVDVGPGDEGD